MFVTAFLKSFSSLTKTNNYISLSLRKYSISLKMAEGNAYAGLMLNDIIKKLEGFAPTSLAESWDNVGLLVDPMVETPINSVMLTNDLTENVLNEAVSHKAGLIVSYHPPIFQGLKSVTSRTWKERLVVKCIKNGIAIYSPHTSWDAVGGGVNDWLANWGDINECQPIKANVDDPNTGAGRLCKFKNPISIKEAYTKIKQHIGISHVRLALARDKDENANISTMALCAGSGASVLNGIKADLYLTGEMFHHDVLNANQNGIHVILCNHSDSERGFLRQFKNKLQKDILNDMVNVHVSVEDRDPLKTV